jgi:DNA-binding transcriptional LysR family regulator
MQLPMRAICVFHAAAKAGSVSKAAAELNVTPSAVTQQIQLLEMQLGTSLMVKVGRRIALTEAGERYFTSIRDQVERITEATDQIRGFRSLMALNVRATPTLSAKWLLPRLGSLIDLHSDLEVRLDGTPMNQLTSTGSRWTSKYGTATDDGRGYSWRDCRRKSFGLSAPPPMPVRGVSLQPTFRAAV